jgi:ribosomal protein S18 acetylase RimI-like enzyme
MSVGQGSGSVRPLGPGDAEACDAIVTSLPYHFGDADGRAACAEAVRTGAGLVCEIGGRVAGFLTWRTWYERSVEITWMAVSAECRRRGVGTALIEMLAGTLPPGTRHLIVTTLAATTSEPGVVDGYAGTRRFYERCGFEPVWEPHGWWNERSQAVLMIRPAVGAGALQRPPG